MRALFAIGALLAAALALLPPAVHGQSWTTEHWTATWGATAGGSPSSANTATFTGQTLRMVVHASIGGNRVRIRLSNEMGSTPLRIGAAHIAVHASGAEIMPGTDRVLTFGGANAVTIPPGAPVLSDPVELTVAPLSELAVSIYLPGKVRAATTHSAEASYVSLPGDFTGAAALPVQRTTLSLPFLTEVDLDSSAAAIVALGDSISSGIRSSPTSFDRWPHLLAQRLQTARGTANGIGGQLSVVNRSSGDYRLLSGALGGSTSGRSALERFDRDVLAVAGVRHVIVQLGLDDINNSPNDNPVSADALIAGYRQLIARAHEKRIAVHGATLTPFEGSSYYSPARESVRQTVNAWIRGAGEFDGVIDFDAATRDPAHHSRLLPAYDSGDHLHPNDLGFKAMVDAVPLTMFGPPGA